MVWLTTCLRNAWYCSSRGKLAVEKQIAGLDEVALPGELIDGVAAIKQDALIAIDEGDL